MTPLLPVDEVVERLLNEATPTPESVHAGLDAALGRYLAEDVKSPVNVPPAANSAMDGYAIRVAEGDMVEGEVYPVSDRIPAGTVGRSLQPGTMARIFTGAPIPEGADTVLIQEDTEQVGEAVRIRELPGLGDNVRPMGQDIAAGERVLAAGARLQPADIGLLASVGLNKVRVRKPLRISILSTGDELVEPGGELAPGQIFNANRYVLAGLIRQLGMESVDLGLVPDNPAATKEALLQGAAESDVILSTGGVSVGEEDYVRGAVEQLGSLDLWRLAIKPGKPLAYGNVQGTPFFGLPGNPVSTFVTFSVVARPYLIALQGGSDVRQPHAFGVADFDYGNGDRREYVRVRVEADKDHGVLLHRYSNQGSGIMSSVSWADALALVEVDQQVSRGDRLRYYLI